MSKDVTQTASVRLKAPATKDPVALLDYIEELHTQLEVAERDREIQNAVFRISEVDPIIWTTGGQFLDRRCKAFCLACSVYLSGRLAI